MEPGLMEIDAPAKVNLFLEVLDLRPDGYHDVSLVNQEIDLVDRVRVVDRVRIEEAPGREDRFEATGPFADAVPGNRDSNTVLRVLDLMRESWPAIPFLDIGVEKNIPAGAGLGGGSSDAAAVAIALRERYLAEVSEADIIRLLGEIGSDMPFAAVGRTARVEGRGERVTGIEFAFDSVCYLLISPPVKVSTAWAYRSLDAIGERPRRDPAGLEQSLREGNYEGFAASVWNAFEAVVFTEYPLLGELVSMMEDAGCDAAWMTGSGSNLVGLCPDEAKARAVSEALEESIDSPVRIVHPYARVRAERGKKRED